MHHNRLHRRRPHVHAVRHLFKSRKKVSCSRICIVTPDLLGPVRNGGIGTSCTYLAYELARSGHDVSVLFTQSPTEVSENTAWMQEYRERNISVTLADEWKRAQCDGKLPAIFPNHRPLLMAHIVYEWLAQKEQQGCSFDIVIFMEWQGGAFYALHAKRTTSLFQNTSLVVQVHSPTLWHSINNADISKSPEQAMTWYMERQSVSMADAVVSPSRYMLDWCAHNGYSVPDDARVLPNLLDLEFLPQPKNKLTRARELVFFGRLEYRKGIVQFCDAVDLLIERGLLPQQITFMGKFAWVGEEHAALYIAKRTHNWPMPVSIVSTYDHTQALVYLSSEGRLAIMPSVADNSPYTVYECLAAHIPFIARDVGGIPELVPKAARAECLCSDNPRSLADKLEVALTVGLSCPGLAFNEQENRQQWRDWLASLIKRKHEAGGIYRSLAEKKFPKVAVCLTHYERPVFLQQAVDALLAQDYPNFEVILADDGSTSATAQRYLRKLQPVFATRGWKIVCLENGFPGRARNLAAQATDAEWLLFFDDDNVARPDMISKFVTAAQRSAAELIVSALSVFSDVTAPQEQTIVEEYFLPLGGIIAYSCLNNAIGDTTSLISRHLFTSLGGFTEDYGLGHEDFELYLKAALSGTHIAILPEVLFWYRRLPEQGIQLSTNNSANRARSMRPFLTHASASMAELAVLAHGAVLGDVTLLKRATVAPFALTSQERTLFAQRDPNAPSSLAAVIREMFIRQQPALAYSLLATLSQKEKSLSNQELLHLIQVQVFDDLEKGQYELVASRIQRFEALTDDEQVRTALYLIIAERCDKSVPLRKELCIKIEQAHEIDTDMLLSVAQFFLNEGQLDTGCRAFGAALLQAEQCYLELRPDVRTEVERKSFSCALQHYVLHGQTEQTPWPSADSFTQVWKKYRNIILNNNVFNSFPSFQYLDTVFGKQE